MAVLRGKILTIWPYSSSFLFSMVAEVLAALSNIAPITYLTFSLLVLHNQIYAWWHWWIGFTYVGGWSPCKTRNGCGCKNMLAIAGYFIWHSKIKSPTFWRQSAGLGVGTNRVSNKARSTIQTQPPFPNQEAFLCLQSSPSWSHIL